MDNPIVENMMHLSVNSILMVQENGLVFRTSSREWGNALTIDDGSIYFTGNTYGDLGGQTNDGYLDAFISKYVETTTTDTKTLTDLEALYISPVTLVNNLVRR